jgi:ribosomal protein S18 acetylase RimI-like enzyme
MAAPDDVDRLAALRASAADPKTASPADAPAVLEVLNAAFAEDPIMDWMIRADARRTAMRRALFEVAVGDGVIPLGHTYFSAGAVAAWVPPNASPPSPGILEQIRLLPKMVRITGWDRLTRLLAIMDAMPKHHPKMPPHFYLYFLGVDPAWRGKGLGSLMLEATLAKVDAVGAPAFLENSNPTNTRLYERHGFRRREIYRARADAPPFEAMWREPGGR